MRHYYINPEWLLSNTARQVYRTAATVTLLFFVMLVSVGVVDHVPESVLPLLKDSCSWACLEWHSQLLRWSISCLLSTPRRHWLKFFGSAQCWSCRLGHRCIAFSSIREQARLKKLQGPFHPTASRRLRGSVPLRFYLGLNPTQPRARKLLLSLLFVFA